MLDYQGREGGSHTQLPCQSWSTWAALVVYIGGQCVLTILIGEFPSTLQTLVGSFDLVAVVQVMNVAMWYNNNSHNVIHLYYTVTGTWVLYESQCLIIQCNCFAHFTIVINWNEYLC